MNELFSDAHGFLDYPFLPGYTCGIRKPDMLPKNGLSGFRIYLSKRLGNNLKYHVLWISVVRQRHRRCDTWKRAFVHASRFKKQVIFISALAPIASVALFTTRLSSSSILPPRARRPSQHGRRDTTTRPRLALWPVMRGSQSRDFLAFRFCFVFCFVFRLFVCLFVFFLSFLKFVWCFVCLFVCLFFFYMFLMFFCFCFFFVCVVFYICFCFIIIIILFCFLFCFFYI